MIPPLGYQKFKGEACRRTRKNICSSVRRFGKRKQIIDMKILNLKNLAITLRDRALDWYMSLATNNPPGTTRTIADIKKLLINEFHKPSLEDQYMNEMIEIRQKPGESVWDIDQIFKRLKGKVEISHDRYVA
jgi:hypothetical protein